MSSVDAVARRKTVILANRCEALEKAIAELRYALQSLWDNVPHPAEEEE